MEMSIAIFIIYFPPRLAFVVVVVVRRAVFSFFIAPSLFPSPLAGELTSSYISGAREKKRFEQKNMEKYMGNNIDYFAYAARALWMEY
jgi:hypothetical protein